MAVQARQVFYVQDPNDSKWSVVLQGRTFSISNHIGGSTLDVGDMPPFSKDMPLINEEQIDDVYATCNDHQERFGWS